MTPRLPKAEVPSELKELTEASQVPRWREAERDRARAADA